jgi:hypothetical protein
MNVMYMLLGLEFVRSRSPVDQLRDQRANRGANFHLPLRVELGAAGSGTRVRGTWLSCTSPCDVEMA